MLNEMYEYRMKYIIRKVLSELELKPEELSPDEMGDALWNNPSQVGRMLVEDMSEWMDEKNWHGLVTSDD